MIKLINGFHKNGVLCYGFITIKLKIMYSNPGMEMYDLRQYAIWLISIFIVAIGFRYVKEVIVFIMDKLYELFIQNG